MTHFNCLFIRVTGQQSAVLELDCEIKIHDIRMVLKPCAVNG